MNPYQRRRAIDAAVDARRKYQSWSFAAIKVRMTPAGMMEALGYPVPREAFALRSDDLMLQWQAVRAGLGIGFVADYQARMDPDVVPVLTGQLQISPLPVWLAVHREIRTSRHIRSVFDFLATALPSALSTGAGLRYP